MKTLIVFALLLSFRAHADFYCSTQDNQEGLPQSAEIILKKDTVRLMTMSRPMQFFDFKCDTSFDYNSELTKYTCSGEGDDLQMSLATIKESRIASIISKSLNIQSQNLKCTNTN